MNRFPSTLDDLAPAASRAEELAILHRVFDGYADRVIKDRDNRRSSMRCCRILVWLDPARAVETLE